MKCFAMLGINKVGWIEKEKPVAGPYDAIVKRLQFTCSSDIHTYLKVLRERTDMI